MTDNSHYAATSAEVQRLLAGGSPNGHHPELFGNWYQAVIKPLYDGHALGGTDEVRTVYRRIVRFDARLATLTTSGVLPAADRMPALPIFAQEVYQHNAPCAAWLDEYLAFAEQAAPMTPRSFHEAAGLAAISTAIARRIVVHASTERIYPNLYFLFMAPSTLWHKSSGMRVLDDLLDRAGLYDRKLPHGATPEALLQELSLNVHEKFWSWPQERRDRWLHMRPFAAKRLWMIDEVSGFFDKAKRDVYAELLTMLLNLYECPPIYESITMSRGFTTVTDAYITFFGVGTPSAMAQHLANRRLWSDGQWARFVLLMPTEQPRWQFFTEGLAIPDALIRGLQRIDQLFPRPSAELIDAPEEAGRNSKVVDLHGDDYQRTCILAPGVWQAWEAYARATMHDLLTTGDVPTELHPAYGRMGTRLMKVAMLLAILDAPDLPVTIELRHMARAQAIMERWRETLHTVWEKGIETEEETIISKLTTMLVQAAPGAIATRELYRRLHLKSKECRELLEELQRTGYAEPITITEHGKAVEAWKWVVSTPTNA